MSTLGALKAQIADDLERSDLTSQITTLIPRAIEFYANERFWFNEERKTVTTTSGNEYVNAPAGLRYEDAVWVTIGSHRDRMTKRDLVTIETWHGATTTSGQPSDYCYVDGQFRIYPTPNDTYTLTVIGVYDQAAFEDDDSSNAWTDEARELIAARVKFVIGRDILRDDLRMRGEAVAMTEALQELRNKAGKKQNRGRIRAHI